jgi:hypothetical protein
VSIILATGWALQPDRTWRLEVAVLDRGRTPELVFLSQSLYWLRYQIFLFYKENIIIITTKFIYNRIWIKRPPLWPSGQSSWLQIQTSGFDTRRYQILWEVVSLKRSPLSLVSTIEELLGRKSSGSGLENREYGRRDQSRWPRSTLCPQRLALTSLGTNSGHGVFVRIKLKSWF